MRDGLIDYVYRNLIAPDPNLNLDALAIEYTQEQTSGVLLLLLELGEYQEVLELGYALLNQEEPQASLDFCYGDILLSIAKAHLELAKELHQQAQYDRAAQLLLSAQELLTQGGGSLNLKSEIQRELDLMRPHRILELLSAPDHNHDERQAGIQLFKDLLHDRHGIDGRGNDRSELIGDDFLRFLQQVRTYLTATEQQALFAEEARRPCAVASYLQAYALTAQGFAEQRPNLIRQARGIFVKIGSYQETYLEQSVCHLLLGQPDRAIHCAERTTNATEMQYIREQSEGEDLLLGLCHYAEKWLREEVYASFRDLQHKTHLISLKIYFADPQVQSYLEELVDNLEVSPPISAQIGTQTVTQIGSPNTNIPSSWARSTPSVPTTKIPEEPMPAPRQRKREVTPKFWNGKLVAAILLSLGISGAILTGSRIFSQRTLPAETVAPTIAPTEITPTPTPTPPPVLDREGAKQIVETWQRAKAMAMGSSYEIASLGEILAEPELSQWRQKSEDLKQEDTYVIYELKSVEIQEVQVEGEATTIVANVVESQTTNRKGEVIYSESNDNAAYQVQYKAILENNQWRIKEMRSLQ